MEPMNLSAYKLAKEIHVPVSRIQAILNGGRRITADTSLRLAKFFGVSDRYFLDIQSDIDIRNLKMSMEKEIAETPFSDCCNLKRVSNQEPKPSFSERSVFQSITR